MKRSLPQSLDQVGGMRAARWFRESTAGQWDNFGPDAQREQQDRAIARYGLADSALEWSVASSGWTSAWRTPTWKAMVVSAQAGAFDVLVVGYVSRFLRNLKQTLIAVEDWARIRRAQRCTPRRVRRLDHAALIYSWTSPPRRSRRSMSGTPSASSTGARLSGT